MARCGQCHKNQGDEHFDQDVRGRLRRTCRNCLVINSFLICLHSTLL